MAARNYTPWTLLRRRLEPLMAELDRATPWRLDDCSSVSDWVKNLTAYDLWWADELCFSICSEDTKLPQFPFSLHEAMITENAEAEDMQHRMAQQVMHRMLFAVDLSNKMSQTWRKEFKLTGDYPHDSNVILIHAWRTNAPFVWAKDMGDLYL